MLTGEQHWREKMEQRPGKTTHARRNLFGPVDHEQLRQDFQHMLHGSIEGVQQKWNFNFLRDVPTEGLLQWEELEGHDVPAFYHSCVVGEARRPLQPLNRPLGRGDKSHHFAQVALTEKPKTSKKTGQEDLGREEKKTVIFDRSLLGKASQNEYARGCEEVNFLKARRGLLCTGEVGNICQASSTFKNRLCRLQTLRGIPQRCIPDSTSENRKYFHCDGVRPNQLESL